MEISSAHTSCSLCPSPNTQKAVLTQPKHQTCPRGTWLPRLRCQGLPVTYGCTAERTTVLLPQQPDPLQTLLPATTTRKIQGRAHQATEVPPTCNVHQSSRSLQPTCGLSPCTPLLLCKSTRVQAEHHAQESPGSPCNLRRGHLAPAAFLILRW